MSSPSASTFDSFGELLKHLRRRAGLTQRELGIAVGYSNAQIARLEAGTRPPDPVVVKTVFLEALAIQHEPELAQCLVHLAGAGRGARAPMAEVEWRQPGRTNLPAQLTRFVGRERELSELLRLVGAQRLVTLMGAAGMGKTRLAVEVGSALALSDPRSNVQANHDTAADTTSLPSFSEGVWLVELAPLTDGALVPKTVAATFKIPDQPSRPPLDALTTFLGGKQVLLTLDNCEHLISACSALVEALLRACPRLHILATSREALRISGEAIWRVPPLRTPDPARMPSPERLAGYDALQLFLEHAALAQPGFAPTPSDLALIARICQQLDGMPLAIEMAAVQVADFSLQGIAAGLADRFALLTAGSRTALPHHQTLRAAIEWSYQLLSAPERALLASLSVFAGGWTATAAKAVCGLDSVTLLLQLVRKSLVAVVPQVAAGETRYRLLETVREYAAEALRVHDRGKVDALCDRHLAYLLGQAEEMTDLYGPHVDAWIQRMEAEYNNLRAAFAWASTRDNQVEAALRLAAGLSKYWFNKGDIVEGMTWLDGALARGGTTRAVTRAHALYGKAILHILQGDLASALRVGEASLALFRQTDDRIGMAWCMEHLANNLNNARAWELAAELLPLFRELGSQPGERCALRALATAALRSGDRAKAARLLEQVLAVDMDISCLDRLYDAIPRRALELCEQELARLSKAGGEDRPVSLVGLYSAFLMAEGKYGQVTPMLEESVRWAQRTGADSLFGYAWGMSFTLIALGMAELSLGNTDRAIACWEQLLKLAHEAGILVVSTTAQFLLASARIAQGDLDLAASDTRECLRRYAKYGHRSEVVCSLVQMADVARRQGEAQRATCLLGAARAFGYEVEAMNYHLDRFMWLWHRNAQRTMVEPSLVAVRTPLGDSEFDAVFDSGRQMTLDQAVAYALEGGEAYEPPTR